MATHATTAAMSVAREKPMPPATAAPTEATLAASTELFRPMNSEGAMHAATWMDTFSRETPAEFCSRGSVCRPAVCEGDMTQPTPANTSTLPTNTPARESWGPKTVQHAMPARAMAKPIGSSGQAPELSMTRPAYRATPALTSTGTSSSRPAIMDDMPMEPS